MYGYGYEEQEPEVQEAPKKSRRVGRSGLGTGTTSLLMIFTLLCLSTLALLSLSTAVGDARIKGRGLETTQELAAAEGEAARLLSELDAALLAHAGEDAAGLASVLDDRFSVDGDTVTFAVDAGEDKVFVTTVQVLPASGGARYKVVGQTRENTAEWAPGASGEVWTGN